MRALKPSLLLVGLLVTSLISPAWAFLPITKYHHRHSPPSQAHVAPDLHVPRIFTSGNNSQSQRSSVLFAATGNLVSGNFISDLAVMAIKLCLASYTDVSCDLVSAPQDIFQGRIGPVKVNGKDWKSSRGLTCRAIEASVDTCQIDMGRILSDQKLVLTKPAEGKCMIAFTAHDFGNFIVHPRLEKAKLKASRAAGSHSSQMPSTESSSPSLIDFRQENVAIDPKDGTVTFYASCAGTLCKCVLQRTGNTEGRKSFVDVTILESSSKDQLTASRLSEVFTDFFQRNCL